MFWNHNTSSSSQIETLLAKEDVTLQEVMDSDEIINDCRGLNKSLLDYLKRREIMEELVNLTTTDPSPDIDERTRYKYPNIACELLTCDVAVLNEKLASDQQLLEKLHSFLENEPPLNPLLASFFSKIMGALIAKKTEQSWLSYQFTCLQVLDFLKLRDNFIPSLLKHLGTSAIMDLMLKLMTQVEGSELREGALKWLNDQGIIQQIICLLNPNVDRERHYNAAQLLCDFIRISRDTTRNSTEKVEPSPLLNTLESPDTISLLLDNILSEEKCETAIVGGIQVLISILDVNHTSIPNSHSGYNDDIDSEQKQKVVASTTRVVVMRLKDFHNLLLNPPKKMPISTTLGTLDPPLGNTRLQVTRLLATLMSSKHGALLEEIISLGTFSIILDLFFKYAWNNFLHSQVESCLVSALKTYVSDDTTDDNSIALCKHLFVDCKLIERILIAWKENDEEQKCSKGVRRGYMGHLTEIANSLLELCSSTLLGQYLKENLPEVAKSFEEFKETTLAETNKIADTLLGGVPVCRTNPANFNDDDYNMLASQNQPLQMFSQYQMQHLIPQYSYSGFGDDSFNDDGDAVLTVRNRTEVNLDLSDGDIAQQQELFKQVCAQNMNALEDADDQIFEEREHTFQTVIEKPGEKNEPTFSSSDSDSEGDDPGMDIDPWSSPKPAESDGRSLLAPDPWSSNVDFSSTDANMSGWADFSAATFDEVCNSKSDDLGEPAKNENNIKIEKNNIKIENDINIDNMEINEKDEKMPDSVADAANGKICEPGCKDVGQEQKNEIAAGDQCNVPVISEPKPSSVSLEPSISQTPKVGDSCVMQTDTSKQITDDTSKEKTDNV